MTVQTDTRAILSPARWATTLDRLDRAELPPIDWVTAEYVSEPERSRFALAKSQPSRRTHCAKGHPYDAENTYTPPGGTMRICRTCRRAAYRLYYNNNYRALSPARNAPPHEPQPVPARPVPTPQPLSLPSARAAAPEPPVPPRPQTTARQRIEARRAKREETPR